MSDPERIDAIRQRIAQEGEWTGGPMFWAQQDRHWLLGQLAAAEARIIKLEKVEREYHRRCCSD